MKVKSQVNNYFLWFGIHHPFNLHVTLLTELTKESGVVDFNVPHKCHQSVLLEKLVTL